MRIENKRGNSLVNTMKLIVATLTLVVAATCVAGPGGKISDADQRTLPEYTAAEATKHIGETARVTGKVGCVLPNRHGGYNLGLGDCDDDGAPRLGSAQTLFWVVTHGDISGPKLDVEELKGVVVTVTGKIEAHENVRRIFAKSTSQIVPHRQ
jgi:hypothetical protein